MATTTEELAVPLTFATETCAACYRSPEEAGTLRTDDEGRLVCGDCMPRVLERQRAWAAEEEARRRARLTTIG